MQVTQKAANKEKTNKQLKEDFYKRLSVYFGDSVYNDDIDKQSFLVDYIWCKFLLELESNTISLYFNAGSNTIKDSVTIYDCVRLEFEGEYITFVEESFRIIFDDDGNYLETIWED